MRPSPAQTGHSFLILCALVSLALAQPTVLAQTGPKGPAPQQIAQTPDPSDQEQIVSYWTTETGWQSELQLRNNLSGKPLTVTPVVRTHDGSETALAPVTIKPQEVTSIDVDAAIAAAAAPQLVGAYGSIVLRYRSPGHRNLYAAVMIRRTGHPVAFHVDATGESQEFQAGSREGIWWLPNDTASDYLIVTNQGKNAIPLTLSLFDAAGRESKQNLLLGPQEVKRYSVRDLVQTAHLAGSYGGITVSAASHAGSLDTLHFLFDEQVAFSAILKMFDHDPNSKLEERDHAKTGVWTLRAPMLALSNPDPALAFPTGTALLPQLFIRNTTGKVVDAALRFNWRNGNSTGEVSGPALHLNPYETHRIDIAALQNGGTFPKEPNWTSVILTTTGLPDEVMAIAASYDETLRYGAQTPFSDQLSFQWEGGMWEYDPYHSSIITAGNGGTKPTLAAFTIFYNQGTQRYDLEQNLLPDEQMWIDVGKLIREHTPDKNGKTLPADLTSGSYEFRDLTNKGVGTLFEGKVIYDKTYGHVTYGCANCCGDLLPHLTFSPLDIPFVTGSQNGVQAVNSCSGGMDDLSEDGDFWANWRTANTAIATVAAGGYHTAVSIGTTSSTTSGSYTTAIQRTLCPLRNANPSGPANVITFTCSPSSVARGSSTTCTVNNAPTGTAFSNWKFTDSSSNVVTSTQTGSSWSGTMVTSGTVSVQVSVSGGNLTTLTTPITATARSNFAFTAVSPTSEPNNSSPSPTCTLSVQSPPVVNSLLGFSCLDQEYGENDTTINDSGPNQGYHYVTSVSSSYQGTSTAYYYVISPDLSNTSSAFYLAQTGTYNAQTNPNGYISGSNLLADTTRHESGTVNSHYQNYVTAQNNPTNNLGVVAEAETGPPSQSTSAFENKIKADLTSAATSIKNGMSVEPCGSQYTYYDATCTFQGYVNYNF